jgi:hypothetical protein
MIVFSYSQGLFYFITLTGAKLLLITLNNQLFWYLVSGTKYQIPDTKYHLINPPQ